MASPSNLSAPSLSRLHSISKEMLLVSLDGFRQSIIPYTATSCHWVSQQLADRKSSNLVDARNRKSIPSLALDVFLSWTWRLLQIALQKTAQSIESTPKING